MRQKEIGIDDSLGVFSPQPHVNRRRYGPFVTFIALVLLQLLDADISKTMETSFNPPLALGLWV